MLGSQARATLPGFWPLLHPPTLQAAHSLLLRVKSSRDSSGSTSTHLISLTPPTHRVHQSDPVSLQSPPPRPRPVLAPRSPAFEMLSASQTAEPPVHHDGQARAERFALLHAAGDRVRAAGCSRPAQGLCSVPPLQLSPPRALARLGVAPSCEMARGWPGAHLCDVSTTERPSRTTDSKLFQRNRRALGSIPVVGSSCQARADSEPRRTPVTAPDLLKAGLSSALSFSQTLPHSGQARMKHRCRPPKLRRRLHAPGRPRLDHQPEPGLWPASVCCLRCRSPQVGPHS